MSDFEFPGGNPDIDGFVLPGSLSPSPLLAPNSYPPYSDLGDELDLFVYSWDQRLQPSQPQPAEGPHTIFPSFTPQQQQQQPATANASTATDDALLQAPDAVVRESPLVGPQRMEPAPHLTRFAIAAQQQQQQQPPQIPAAAAAAAADDFDDDGGGDENDDFDVNGGGDGDEEYCEGASRAHRGRGPRVVADTPRKPKAVAAAANAAAGRRVGVAHPAMSFVAGKRSSGGGGNGNGGGRAASTRLPDNAIDALKAWLLDHLSNPYPSKEEKTAMALHTGLSVSQVNNWFINARRRFVRPMEKAEAAAAARK